VQPPSRPFLEARIRVPPGWEETLLSLLQDEGLGAAAAEWSFPAGALEGESLGGRIPTVTAWLEAGEEPRLRRLLEGLAAAAGWRAGDWCLRTRFRPPEDWSRTWRRRWRPFRCAGFAVLPPGLDPSSVALRAEDRPLLLAEGSAFGTGGHVSTRLALRALREQAREDARSPLLDLGTGSGILAVAAALLGAERVLGVDPDPHSPPQACATARGNGVGDRCFFWRGTLESAGGRWRRVLANLHSDLLVEAAPFLGGLVEAGGWLFTGGVLDRKEEAVRSALAAAGFEPLQIRRGGRWLGLAWKRQVLGTT